MARILISENCEVLSRQWRDELVNKGHFVELVLDGRAAISACRESDFEVVITDMALPDVNGVMLSGQITMLLPNVSIIALSDQLTDQMVADELDGDIPFVDRFFCKPVPPTALTEAVNELAVSL